MQWRTCNLSELHLATESEREREKKKKKKNQQQYTCPNTCMYVKSKRCHKHIILLIIIANFLDEQKKKEEKKQNTESDVNVRLVDRGREKKT